MPRCYECCKYYRMSCCTKYNKHILHSKNIAHIGLPLHPLEYLTLYYNHEHNDINHLMDIAEKCLTDDVSNNIIEQYKHKGYISFKQRKLLVWKLTNCYEPKESRL